MPTGSHVDNQAQVMQVHACMNGGDTVTGSTAQPEVPSTGNVPAMSMVSTYLLD